MPLQASQTALQYVDANTWVGADTNANFDADDELVFMAFDAGSQVQGANPGQPSGVVAGSGVAVQVQETRVDGGTGWVYLFRSTTLNPAAGQNYVTLQLRPHQRQLQDHVQALVGRRTAREPGDVVGGDPELHGQVHRPVEGDRLAGDGEWCVRRRLPRCRRKDPAQPDRLRHEEQQDALRGGGRVRGQHRRAGAWHPLLRGSQQRSEHPAHPLHVPRPSGRGLRPPGPQDPVVHGLRRLQLGGLRNDLPELDGAGRGHDRRRRRHGAHRLCPPGRRSTVRRARSSTPCR